MNGLRYRVTYLERVGEDFTTHELETTLYGSWPTEGLLAVYEETWDCELDSHERVVLAVEPL